MMTKSPPGSLMALPFSTFAVITLTRGGSGRAWTPVATAVLIMMIAGGFVLWRRGQLENPRSYGVVVGAAAALLLAYPWPALRVYGFAACLLLAGVLSIFPVFEGAEGREPPTITGR